MKKYLVYIMLTLILVGALSVNTDLSCSTELKMYELGEFRFDEVSSYCKK